MVVWFLVKKTTDFKFTLFVILGIKGPLDNIFFLSLVAIIYKCSGQKIIYKLRR